MILVPYAAHSSIVTEGLRKTSRFLLIEKEQYRIVFNPCRRDTSDIFFAWFDTLGVERVYIKNIGLRTFGELQQRGIDVFLLPPDTTAFDIASLKFAKRLHENNAAQYCTMEHG